MCTHDSVYEDEHTGDVVCTDCGFVIDTFFPQASVGSGGAKNLADSEITGDESTNKRFKRDEALGGMDESSAQVLQAREIIADVCAHMHEEAPCLIDAVLHIYLEVGGLTLSYEGCCDSEEQQSKSTPQPPSKKRTLINLTSINCRAKLAYALLEALARQGTPWSPLDIARRLDVHPKHILAVENKCCQPTTYSCPSQYMERICAFLGLPFYVGMLARQLCEHIEDDFYGFQPEGLVAACVLAIIEKVREKEKSPYLFQQVTPDTASSLLGISLTTIMRCKSKLPLFGLKRRFDYIRPFHCKPYELMMQH